MSFCLPSVLLTWQKIPEKKKLYQAVLLAWVILIVFDVRTKIKNKHQLGKRFLIISSYESDVTVYGQLFHLC